VHRGAWAVACSLLIAAGTLASVLGARAVGRSDAEKARLAFHLASAEVASTLKLAIQHEEDLVMHASAFVSVNPNASAVDFDRWAESAQAIQRYPELKVFGLVTLVPASRLAAFGARIAANPIRPLGAQSVGPKERFRVLPAGHRPYYCLAVGGLARSAADFVPGGLDYCALAPTLITARDSGLTGYAPFAEGDVTNLGVETPVYGGGVVPLSVTARRRAFLGWLGELLVPNVVLERALEGHPNLAVIFRYDSPFSHVVFTRGAIPTGAQRSTIELQVGRAAGLPGSRQGWTVQTFGARAAGGVFAGGNSLVLLVGGTLLSVLVGLLVLVLATGRRRALSLVREKTRDLSYQALHDALTELPNRKLVIERGEQMLNTPGTVTAALFVDLDGFKHINDRFGHAAGDQLLKVTAQRLQSVVREQDMVGRLGGDEFVVLLESTADEARPNLIAERLIEVLRQPVALDSSREVISVSASVGIAVGRQRTVDELLRDADLALYAAKADGKDRYMLFEAAKHGDAEDLLTSEIS
jgi:diguanylate cyclase (GGDEF)-like protein